MIKIANDVVQTIDETVIDRNRTEEHDSGFLNVLSTRSERYEMYDLVTIDINGNVEQMLVQADVITKLKSDLFQHEITIVEVIAYFDAIFPADRIFSSLQPKTLGQILTVYKTELEKYHNVLIDFDSTASWTQEFIRQKEFSAVNFTVVLMDLFKSIDAIPRCEYNETENKWVISPEFYRNRNKLIDLQPQGQIVTQNNADYATKIRSQLKNATNDSEVFFPSALGFILPKSSTPQRVDSNLQYVFDSNIADISEALVASCTVRYSDSGFLGQLFGGVEFDFVVENIDIIPHVLPKEAYDGLQTPVNQEAEGVHKKNSIYYNIGGRTIDNLFAAGTEQLFFGFGDNVDFLKNAILEVLYQADIDVPTIGSMQVAPKSYFSITTDLHDIKMRFKYVRQRNLDITSHRQFLNNMNEATATHRQRDSFADINRYSASLKAIINRMGNEIQQRSNMFDINDAGVELGDYDAENRVVIRVKKTITDNNVMAEYTLAQGFGNIDADTSLWREPSAFEIQKKDITTNIIIEEFVEISEVQKIDSTRLTQRGRDTLFSTFDSSIPNYGRIQAGIMRPVVTNATQTTTNGIYLPAFVGSGGNTSSINVRIDDPISAGRGFSDDYEDGEFGLDFIYTYDNDDPLGEFGELQEFSLFFITDIGIDDNGNYPIPTTTELSSYITEALTETNLVDRIDKDKNAKFAVTYEHHFVTSEKDIIVCNGITKYNKLISDLTPASIGFIKRDVPFNIFDVLKKDTDATMSASLSVSGVNGYIDVQSNEQADYWALVFDNDIIFAFNSFIDAGQTRRFYLNLLSQATREPSNNLDIPLLRTTNIDPTQIQLSLLNLNNEPVEIFASLSGDAQSQNVAEYQQDIGLATATFTWTDLQPNKLYEISAQARATAGSTKDNSPFGSYSLTTDKLPLDPPIATPKRFETYQNAQNETKYIVIFDVTNSNDIQLEFVANVDGGEQNPSQGGAIPANTTVEIGIVTANGEEINADQTYSLQTRWETVTFENNWLTPYTPLTFFEIGTFDPPNFGTANATAATVSFSWGNPNNVATQLQVQLLSAPFPQGTVEQTKTVNIAANGGKTVTFNNVNEETFYGSRAKLLSTALNNESSTVDSSTIQTNAFQNQSAPDFVLAGGITTTSLSASFSNPNNHSVTMFAQITVQGSGTVIDTTEINIGPNTSNSVTFNNLEPNTDYIISAYFKQDNNYNQSPTEVSPVITTAQDTTAAPTIDNISANTDTVTFDITNNDDDFAIIRYGLNTQDPSVTTNQVASNDTVSLTFSGLDDGTEYTLAATAQANDEIESSLVEETFTTVAGPASQWVYIGEGAGAFSADENVASTPSPIPTTCPTLEQAKADALAAIQAAIDPTTKPKGYIVSSIRLANSPLRSCWTVYYEAQ